MRADAAQAHLEAYDAWKQLDIAGKTLSNSGQEKEMVRSHLVPGLRHALQARDLCPTLPRPHVLIANHVEQLARADSRASYLERATFLLPFDPEIWYFRGLQEYLSGQLDQACSSWRHSLELSDRRLPEILRTCAGRLSSREIIDHVLPRKADLLVATAMALYPEPEGMGLRDPERWHRTPHLWAGRLFLASAGAEETGLLPVGGVNLALALARDYLPIEERRPFLEQALRQLEEQSASLTAKDLHTKAIILWTLWDLDRAREAFPAALGREPLNSEWRFEYARLLFQQGDLQNALDEVNRILFLPSPPTGAEAFQKMVTLEKAKKKKILKE